MYHFVGAAEEFAVDRTPLLLPLVVVAVRLPPERVTFEPLSDGFHVVDTGGGYCVPSCSCGVILMTSPEVAYVSGAGNFSAPINFVPALSVMMYPYAV